MYYVAALNALQNENGLTNWLETFQDYVWMDAFALTLFTSDLVQHCWTEKKVGYFLNRLRTTIML